MVQLLGYTLVVLLLAISDARRLSHGLYDEALLTSPSRTLQAAADAAFLGGALPLRVITSIPSALTGEIHPFSLRSTPSACAFQQPKQTRANPTKMSEMHFQTAGNFFSMLYTHSCSRSLGGRHQHFLLPSICAVCTS